MIMCRSFVKEENTKAPDAKVDKNLSADYADYAFCCAAFRRQRR
jgi:hypothetical protein